MGSSGEKSEALGTAGSKEELRWTRRVEIDTSPPFESVKEAVDHFGGSGRWKHLNLLKNGQQSSVSERDNLSEEVIVNVEKETRQLEKDLIVKERETLGVLKELEGTKRMIDGLKAKLRRESSGASSGIEEISDGIKVHPITKVDDHSSIISEVGTKPSPGSILMELKQAKLNLKRTTSDLAEIRTSVKAFKNEIEKEKISMEKTLENVRSNSARIYSLDKDICQTRLMLQVVKDTAFNNGSGNPALIARKFHELRSEAEQFRRMAAASESEISKIAEDIEQKKSRIKTLEVRMLAARKVEEASKATQLITLSEIEGIETNKSSGTILHNSSGVTLNLEEYNSLVQKAQKAEVLSRKKIESAVKEVDEAKKSKISLSKEVEEAEMEVRNSQKQLTEALHRMDIANEGKQVVEEALQKWRPEHGHKRRCSVHCSPRFKNTHTTHHRLLSKSLDINISDQTADNKFVPGPTLSIGQILTKKLMHPKDCEDANMEFTKGKPKFSTKFSPKHSLGQILNIRYGISSPDCNGGITSSGKPFLVKRKFGFVGNFSMILVSRKKRNRKKKKRQARTSKLI